ncbi:MAG TPA: hypothetical protein VH724_01510 [Candidatus Angelobacter sp.]|nr:hypothetical protein [Candidatus Angelobacter sp.]
MRFQKTIGFVFSLLWAMTVMIVAITLAGAAEFVDRIWERLSSSHRDPGSSTVD